MLPGDQLMLPGGKVLLPHDQLLLLGIWDCLLLPGDQLMLSGDRVLLPRDQLMLPVCSRPGLLGAFSLGVERLGLGPRACDGWWRGWWYRGYSGGRV